MDTPRPATGHVFPLIALVRLARLSPVQWTGAFRPSGSTDADPRRFVVRLRQKGDEALTVGG